MDEDIPDPWIEFPGTSTIAWVQPITAGDFRVGDYVLATKYSDASCYDPFAVGYIESVHDAAVTIDCTGQRQYGYARKIDQAEGDWIVRLYTDHGDGYNSE